MAEGFQAGCARLEATVDGARDAWRQRQISRRGGQVTCGLPNSLSGHNSECCGPFSQSARHLGTEWQPPSWQRHQSRAMTRCGDNTLGSTHCYNTGDVFTRNPGSKPGFRIGRGCRGTGSNRRHRHFQCRALPTELPRRVANLSYRTDPERSTATRAAHGVMRSSRPA
jgi:hypothetical protein